VTAETEVDVERTGLGVHASSEHNVLQVFLLFKVITVVDESVIDDLTDQTNGRLSAVLVDVWHVKIVHEEDQDLSGRRSVDLTGSLVDITFNDSLEGLGVSVRVKVDGGGEDGLGVDVGEVILDNGGLTGTGVTDIQYALAGVLVDVDDILLTGSLGGGHDQVAVKTFVAGVEGLNTLLPVLPAAPDDVEVVVIDLTSVGELDLAGCVLDGGREAELALVERSTE